MYTYTARQMYLFGQVYRCLNDILGTSNCNPSADIFPVKHLVMVLVRVPHKNISKRIDTALQEIMDSISPEEMEELIANPSPTPMDLRLNWQLGYSDGYKLLQPSPIAKKRKEKGLTQDELAKIVGCTQKDISRWEGFVCKPQIENFQKLATALNCSVDELL